MTKITNKLEMMIYANLGGAERVFHKAGREDNN